VHRDPPPDLEAVVTLVGRDRQAVEIVRSENPVMLLGDLADEPVDTVEHDQATTGRRRASRFAHSVVSRRQ
jgi:hypothetical protein